MFAKPITQLLALLIIMLVSHMASALSLTANVDRDTLGIDETLILTITLDKQGGDQIDFSDLSVQFDILNQQRSSQTSIINGRISAKTQWTLILAPKKPGNLLIPSFSTEGEFSDAIPIKVAKSSTVNGSSNNGGTSSSTHLPEVFLAAKTDKSRIYVQEQVLLTLEVYYRISLSGYTPQEVKLDNATVELVAENTTQKQHNGARYNVLQKIYAVHPQSSGELKIPAQTWQVEKATRGFHIGQISSPYLRIRSLPLSIEVMPTPNASSAQHWLPSPQLALEQQWQQSIVTAQAGEPLTYSLIMEAQGLNHSQLPALELESNQHFTIYGDKATTENVNSAQGITGKRTENYAVIPKTPGTFTFPRVKLKWWNTRTDREETITLPEQVIIVANSSINEQNSTNNLPPLKTPAEEISTPKHTAAPVILWQITTAFAFMLALIFFTLWLRARHLSANTTAATAQTQEQPRPRKTVKTMQSAISAAINNEDWPLLKQHLLEWASLATQTPLKNSAEVIHYFPELRPYLQQLDNHLYSDKAGLANVDSQVMNKLLNAIKHQKLSNTPKPTTKQDTLSPLYPS